MRTGGDASGISIDPPIESLGGLANFPNPFTKSTEFRYALREDARVTLEIFDLQGRCVDIVVDQWQLAGPQRAIWDPSRLAVPLESGIYFARLTADRISIAKKVHLTK